MVEGLAEALEQDADNTRLAVLVCSSNSLSIASLAEFAAVLPKLADTVEELDLSSNLIAVNTIEAQRQWELFLTAIGTCRTLRKINLANNDLSSPLAWDSFYRVYSLQFSAEFSEWEKVALADVNAALQSSSLVADSDPLTKSETRPRGLPSIAMIDFAECRVNDAGATFLASVIERHHWAAVNLQAATEDPSSKGVIVGTVTSTTATGFRLLTRADNIRSYQPYKTSLNHAAGLAKFRAHAEARRSHPLSSTIDGGQEMAQEEIESLRKKLQRGILEEHQVKVVKLWSIAMRFLVVARAVLLQTPAELADAARFLDDQVQAYEEALATHAATQSSQSTVAPDNGSCAALRGLTSSSKEDENERPSYASRLMMSRPQPGTMEATHAQSRGFATSVPPEDGGYTVRIAAQPSQNRTQRQVWCRPCSRSRSKPSRAARKPSHELPGYEKMLQLPTKLLKGLPAELWMSILLMSVDPNNILSRTQVESVAAWARNRLTLKLEAETRAKPESYQLMKVLDAVGCLNYDYL